MKSLNHFPKNFSPLVIVTGDRRENPPQSKGDMLAYSVSNTDLMYVNYLKLEDTLILSDKIFIVEPEDRLRKRFGKTNMLVIGSPAVNWLARKINNESIFKFAVAYQTVEDITEQIELMEKWIHNEDDLFIYGQCLDGVLDKNRIVDRFIGLEPDIDKLVERAGIMIPELLKTSLFRDLKTNPRPIRSLLHRLDKPGIYDSLTKIVRGESITAYKDYGLISVVRNIYSDSGDYWIIYVAGIHGPGTALGLRLLADKKAFIDHPFGGVYEVKIDRFAGYFEKFQQSKVRWETPAYKESSFTKMDFKIQRSMKAFLSSPSDKKDTDQINFNTELRKLLKNICINLKINLIIEDPYTLPMTGRFNFWETILDYEKECDFVIHDMTECKNGVMVEIGFTYGINKQHFLVWNSHKIPVDNWSSVTLPSLLPVENVEVIDIINLESTKNILETKIIRKVRDVHPDCSQCEGLVKDKSSKYAYLYFREEILRTYLCKELEKRNTLRISEEDSQKELRICRICQVLQIVDYVFLEITDEDPDSFIILGMAKSLGVKTLPFSLARYNKKDFMWARDVKLYHLDQVENLGIELSKFLQY